MLAALAARAEGPTVIRDAQELKDKDTDRIATTIATLRPFGVQIEAREDGFRDRTVTGLKREIVGVAA